MDLAMHVHYISFLLYNIFLIPMIFFSVIYYMAAIRSILSRDEQQEAQKKGVNWPRVTVQIPTCNEPVAIRCAKSCLQFDYPKDKVEIIIGDDSTDTLTSESISRFAQESGGRVKVTHRGQNNGFKAGNLNHMLKYSNGEIIVIFDSDFIAQKDFLKRIVAPFIKDPAIGCVQAEWDFMNEKTNYISKLSSTLLTFYYSLIVPINKRVGVPLLFGSGEAVRKSVIVDVGGWDENSLTEDTDFSLRVLNRGYRIDYLGDLKVFGEVPYTLKGLISQQRRWAYGNTRAFVGNIRSIIFGPLSLLQKMMITYTTYVGYVSNFVFLLFLISGFVFFFSQPQGPIDVMKFVTNTTKMMLITSGFVVGGVIALHKKNKMNLASSSLISTFTVGVLVSVSVCMGFFNAVIGKQMEWSAIKKEGNVTYALDTV